MRLSPTMISSTLLLASACASAQTMLPERLTARAAQLRAEWQIRAASGAVPSVPTEPSITGGKILTPNVDVTKQPGVPALLLAISGGTAGLDGGQATLVSPDGLHSAFAGITLPGYPPAPAKYAVTTLLQSPFTNGGFGVYTQPGTWTIASILLTSGDGQFITYSSGQLAALFHGPATFNVINPNPVDTKPPMIGKGEILTPTVSLSAAEPYAAVRLALADNLSGVVSASISFSVPQGYFGGNGTYATSGVPFKIGSLTTYMRVPSTLPTGTYTITGLTACDAAGNCASITAPAEIASRFSSATITITK